MPSSPTAQSGHVGAAHVADLKLVAVAVDAFNVLIVYGFTMPMLELCQ